MLSSVSLQAVIRPTVPTAKIESLVAEVLIADRRGKQLDSADGWLRVQIGSPLGFRMFGMRGRDAWRRLPIVVRTRQSGSDFIVRLDSNEGWYIRRVALVDAEFDRSFRDVVVKLTKLLQSAEPARYLSDGLIVNP